MQGHAPFGVRETKAGDQVEPDTSIPRRRSIAHMDFQVVGRRAVFALLQRVQQAPQKGRPFRAAVMHKLHRFHSRSKNGSVPAHSSGPEVHFQSMVELGLASSTCILHKSKSITLPSFASPVVSLIDRMRRPSMLPGHLGGAIARGSERWMA